VSNVVAMSAANSIPALAMSEAELAGVLQSSLYPGASMPSIKMVISYCRAALLDPMQKPVHIVPMWDKNTRSMRDVIMPGIGLYRTQAARTGEYAGMSEPEFGPDVTERVGGVDMIYPKWCKVVVRRLLPNGSIAEFPAVEYWRENYATAGKDKSGDPVDDPNAMWKKRPYGQIAKCAEAQALRKAFPEIGSQPTAEEMEGKTTEVDMGPAEVVQAAQSGSRPAPMLPEYTEVVLSNDAPNVVKAINAGRVTVDRALAQIRTRFTVSPEMEKALRDRIDALLTPAAAPAYPSPEQRAELNELAQQWGIGDAEICKQFGVQSISELRSEQHEAVVSFVVNGE
jgi:phage recombination protein Bet